MKIPSKIILKGRAWSVKYKSNLTDEKLGECNALTDWVENTITLDRCLKRDEKEIALLHELIHIILDEYNLHEDGGIRDDFAFESICAGVARTLPELFLMRFRQEAWTAVARDRSKLR